MLTPGESPAALPGTPAGASDQLPFASLVQNITTAKKRKYAEMVMGVGHHQPALELEIPPNADLTYKVYVRDATDGTELSPVTTYRHDAMMVQRAFSYLSSSLQAEGHTPAIEIQTPFQNKTIESDEDWESAVLSIYNVRRSGGVVVIDVWV